VKRFLAGLIVGAASGTGAYCLDLTKGDAVAAVAVGLLVAAVIWLSVVGDVIVDCFEFIFVALLKGLGVLFRDL
jgi:hypothetical protein